MNNQKTEANKDGCAPALAVAPGSPLPKEPPAGLLMSMALRYDHALGCPGYYDQPLLAQSGITHARRLECTLSTMRQLYEEVAGYGFYSPERDAYYVAMREANVGSQPQLPKT